VVVMMVMVRERSTHRDHKLCKTYAGLQPQQHREPNSCINSSSTSAIDLVNKKEHRTVHRKAREEGVQHIWCHSAEIALQFGSYVSRWWCWRCVG
jgi:hypothetical protein